MTDGRHLLVRRNEDWLEELVEISEMRQRGDRVAEDLYKLQVRTIHEARLAGVPQKDIARVTGLSQPRIAQLNAKKLR